MEPPTQAPKPPSGPAPSWCTCGRCREMPNPEERVCCGQLPCDSTSGDVAVCCLNTAVLRTAANRHASHKFRFQGDHSTASYRHLAYTQYVLLMYGHLGRGNRVVCPSCVVWLIRDTFPSPDGTYKGYRPS